MSHVRTVAPTLPAVTTEEAKTRADITGSADDVEVDDLVLEAQAFLEARYDIAIMTQTWRLTMDGFYDPRHTVNDAIVLNRPPFGSVSSFTYLDTAGASQTLVDGTDYQIDTDGDETRVRPYHATSWPATRDDMNSVTLTHTAGYTESENVPLNWKEAIKQYVKLRMDPMCTEMTDDWLRGMDALMSRNLVYA